MSHYHPFGDYFDEFKSAARDFGDFVRDAADQTAWCGREGFFEGEGARFGQRPFTHYLFPRANVFTDRDGALVFEFMLPGYDEDSIGLSFKGDKMILKARSARPAAEREERQYEIRRFAVRDIDYREYPVPADRYAQDRVRATYKSGILTVAVPRREDSPETVGVKIEIEREGN